MTSISAKIAKLEAELQAGITSITVDGTTTTVSLEEKSRQLALLRQQDETQAGRKPRMASIRVGGLS